MSRAIEETLKKLEGTYISDSSAAAAAAGSSPSIASTASAAPSPHGSDAAKVAKDNASATPTTDSPASAASVVLPSPEHSQADTDGSGVDTAAGRHRSRRVVQSMYGAPPGYNASMGVGGARDAVGRGRIASGRQRNSIMVPDQLQAAMLPQNIAPMSPLQPPQRKLTSAEYALMANMPDDAIPNAIVVKNINFVVKRESLLQTMADLGLPLPYAFNYHFDGGVFRGLAFGNFRTPEEAARVIIGLNGVTLLGRPLKVEYKKALPGMAPPPHPNMITMMSALAGNGQPAAAPFADEVEDPNLASALPASAPPVVPQQQQYNQPIPRPRRAHNGELHERPKSMMVFPSAMPMPMPEPSPQQQQQQQQQQQTPNVNDTNSMIDLDDKDTRLLYDLVSQFRHDKGMAELEFPSTLNTKQRQSVMLIAERFGLNHETKGEVNSRYIRVYKGLETLLEATEVRRRSMVTPNPGLGAAGQPSQRYPSSGRSRPASMMVYPDSLAMNGVGGIASPPPQHVSMYQHQSYHQEPARGRSYTHSQGAQFAQHHQPLPQQHSAQPFPRANDHPGRASGSYVGYPSRLYQDSVVVPSRQPRGPDMAQNFVPRQQMHQQEERQMQRQMQLKVLQQNRQRRLSSATEEGAPASYGSSHYTNGASSASPAFKIEKPVSKAIPIVKPQAESGKDSTGAPAGGKEQQDANEKK